MRKNVIVLSGLVLAMLFALSSIGPVHGDINDWMWLEPTFIGVDEFYGLSVTAYREGSTAKLGVIVDRDGAPMAQVNITAVSVVFDWGGNYTLALTSPFVLDDTITRAAFTVTFTVPATTVASNLFLHIYRIYVKYVTTIGPNTFSTPPTDSFAVYSATQANAQALNQQVDAYPDTWSFSSSEADALWEKGNNAAASGDAYYANGDFANAVASYQSALDFFNAAFEAEKTYQSAAQTAQNTALSNYYNAYANTVAIEANASKTRADASMIEANAAQTEANAALKQVDAALTNAYGWLAFGIGWILIGVGVIVYGLRKPKPPA